MEELKTEGESGVVDSGDEDGEEMLELFPLSGSCDSLFCASDFVNSETVCCDVVFDCVEDDICGSGCVGEGEGGWDECDGVGEGDGGCGNDEGSNGCAWTSDWVGEGDDWGGVVGEAVDTGSGTGGFSTTVTSVCPC